MTTTVTEGYLEFHFAKEWRIVKYDDHNCYRCGIGPLDGTKAVDFLGMREAGAGRLLFFIEVKDFRGQRIENKARLSDGELAIEVGQKLRDTVAGLVGARRTGDEPDLLQPAVAHLIHPRREVRVVLWLEEDNPANCDDVRRHGRKSVLGRALKRQLRWLGAKVLVTSMDESNNFGITVQSLAGARGY